jgi:hypothetical protein
MFVCDRAYTLTMFRYCQNINILLWWHRCYGYQSPLATVAMALGTIKISVIDLVGVGKETKLISCSVPEILFLAFWTTVRRWRYTSVTLQTVHEVAFICRKEASRGPFSFGLYSCDLRLFTQSVVILYHICNIVNRDVGDVTFCAPIWILLI